MLLLTRDIDIQLIERLRNDEYDAFNAIYERYWERLYAFGYKLTEDKNLALQLTQDLFVQLWEKRNTSEIKNLKAYLFQSLKFQFFKMYKKRPFRMEELSDSFEDYVLENMDAFHPDILRFLRNALEILPEKRKEILLLNKYQNMCPAEIAEILNLSTQTVRNQISLALKQLRKYFNENPVDLSIKMTVVLLLLQH